MLRKSFLCLAATIFGAALYSPAFAEREPVLKQIDVPHTYYWREMYTPQLTSGPSSLAWRRARSWRRDRSTTGCRGSSVPSVRPWPTAPRSSTAPPIRSA